jgi:hypothetical protein
MFPLTRPGRRARRPARSLCRPLSLEDRTVPSVFTFTTGSPDGLMAIASHQAGLTPETEAADDFILSTETTLTETSFTGLVPTTTTPGSYLDVTVEIYRVFPFDSDTARTPHVPTRANSPSDVAFTTRDFKAGGLSFGFEVLNPSFHAANSVVTGIHPSPHQTTGGDGPVTGIELQFDVAFSLGLDLPAGHYFMVPQVKLRQGTFEWLSAPSKQFTGDLQAWVRNSHLDPDWLRVGTDIVGGTTPPTFDGSFSLLGNTVTPTFAFSTGSPDGRMATASHPASLTAPETESADDFILTAGTVLTQGTLTGLLPTGFKPSDIRDVDVEIYRVFPFDSDLTRTIHVPTRVNSPSDVVFTTRDARKGGLSYGFEVLNPSFTAANSVVSGIHPSPHQTTGGEGPVTGEEVQFDFSFAPGLYLPAGHYFFVPQVKLRRGAFEWLSTPSNLFTGDLQEWIRNSHLDPDWLRVGTDVVGGTTPPKFNAAFSLSGRAP